MGKLLHILSHSPVSTLTDTSQGRERRGLTWQMGCTASVCISKEDSSQLSSPLLLPVLGRLTLTFSRPQKNIICGVSHFSTGTLMLTRSEFLIHNNIHSNLEHVLNNSCYLCSRFLVNMRSSKIYIIIKHEFLNPFNVQRPIVPEQSRETASIKISQLTEAPFTDYSRTNVRGINLTSHLFCEEQGPDTQHEECDMGFMM